MENLVGRDLYSAVAICKMNLNIPHYKKLNYSVRQIGEKLSDRDKEYDSSRVVFWMLNGSVHRAPQIVIGVHLTSDEDDDDIGDDLQDDSEEV